MFEQLNQFLRDFNLSTKNLYTNSKALFVLTFFHLIIIISSNYLVQIPINIASFHTTWGAFTFPFVFLITDLTVRVFGAPLARKIIFCAMIPSLFISYAVSIIFKDAVYQGFANFKTLDIFVLRIALASFIAYCVGQITDIYVFNRLRQNKKWWVAPFVSTFFGNALDACLFFCIAFYKSSNEFMSIHWLEIAGFDYITRMIICLFFFLPAYGIILNFILKYLRANSNV